jgi:hypothetical protein
LRLGIAGIGVAAHAFDIVEAEVRAPGGEEEGSGGLGRAVSVSPSSEYVFLVLLFAVPVAGL